MQLASTSTPRSANNSATCSYDSGYRRYQRTHKMTTSPGCWRPLKGSFGVIGMHFSPTNMAASEVRNGTVWIDPHLWLRRRCVSALGAVRNPTISLLRRYRYYGTREKGWPT